MVSISGGVAFLLGIFEFWLIFKSEVLGDFSSLNELKLFPPLFTHNKEAHLLLCAFTLFLGLLRITWAVSGKTHLSWLCVILTHVIEATFLWNLALLPHFNTKGLALVDFAKDLITGTYNIPSTVLLFLVPGFALFFLLCGPGLKKDSKKAKSN